MAMKKKPARPKRKGIVSKIKTAVKRRRRPGKTTDSGYIDKDGKIVRTGGKTVTNRKRTKVRKSNMTGKGVDRTTNPKASVTRDFKKRKSLGYKEKTVSLKNTRPGARKKDLRGTITKTKKNITTGKTKTTTRNVTASKARRVLKRMNKKTDRMIRKNIRKSS